MSTTAEQRPRDWHTVVVSREGAAIYAEKLELSEAAKRRLSTGVRSMRPPRSRVPAEGAGR